MNASLQNLKIILGITGGIAAYKSVELVRELRKIGARVRVVMTEHAKAFITPLTLQAISGEPVLHHLMDEQFEAAMGHIELARWADLILIAPASANFLAKCAHGFANDLLSTLCLATRAPIWVVPAMNQQMWLSLITQENIARLKKIGVIILGPDVGEQACGEFGPGRMLEPAAIAALVDAQNLKISLYLQGCTVLITAGPTREPLDPVRFISNRSSGKMGYALANAALAAGARVILISGPTALECPAGVARILVETAEEMLVAVKEHVCAAQIFIGAAAVCDYQPLEVHSQKIPKNSENMRIDLRATPDIIHTVAALPHRPVMIGFAAQTHDVKALAQKKLSEKNLDMIIANQVGDGFGFDNDDNEVMVITQNQQETLPKQSKTALAVKLIEKISQLAAFAKDKRQE